MYLFLECPKCLQSSSHVVDDDAKLKAAAKAVVDDSCYSLDKKPPESSRYGISAVKLYQLARVLKGEG